MSQHPELIIRHSSHIYTLTWSLLNFLSCIKTSEEKNPSTSSTVHHSIRETDLHNSARVSAGNMLIFSCTTGISPLMRGIRFPGDIRPLAFDYVSHLICPFTQHKLASTQMARFALRWYDIFIIVTFFCCCLFSECWKSGNVDSG